MKELTIPPREKNENGRAYAFRTIRENILQLNLEPGSDISENELAAALSLSRTPVREALIELMRMDLVAVYPQRGSSVTRIDSRHIEEARFLRNLLEKAVVEIVCAAADNEDIKALDENVDLYGYYAEKGKKEKLLELDNDFHKLLFSIAGKTQLYEMMRGFSIHYDRLRRISLMADKEDKVLSDHRKIVEAIKAKDAALASQTMETHLNRYQINLSDMMAKYPQYFKA